MTRFCENSSNPARFSEPVPPIECVFNHFLSNHVIIPVDRPLKQKEYTGMFIKLAKRIGISVDDKQGWCNFTPWRVGEVIMKESK